VNTLDNSRAELERFFASLGAVRSPDTVDALPVAMVGEGPSSVGQVEERPVRLAKDAARVVGRTLLSADSYEAAMSACFFEPAVALRFRRGRSVVQVLVCFRCGELVFEEPGGRALSGRMKLGSGRAPLLAAAKKAFPDHQEIQALKE